MAIAAREPQSQAVGARASGPATRRSASQSPRRPVHGVLLLDKPVGWTSNDVLQKTKGLLRADKGGHAGTLDPLASGLLPLCFGAAAKFAHAGLEADKRYRATLRLGRRTTTGDAEGELVEERAVRVDRDAIDEACRRHTGALAQRPPMHSALKLRGCALYVYARAGIEIDRPERIVTVHRIAIVEWSGETLVIDIECSKGTYVRTLADDIGTALGCGAYLSALRRTGCGGVDVGDATTIAAIEATPESARAALLLPVDALLAGWPEVRLRADDARRFLHGQRRPVARADASAVRVYADDSGAFLGTARIAAGELIAERLLNPNEVQDRR
jgi:tRNA pseudouridine55 synthase